jgi:diguanylate cyclase (GGDEF)-like protein
MLRSDLVASLAEEEREWVSARSGILQLRRGGRLFSEGERAEHFFILLSGSIRIFQAQDDAQEKELARFAPGDSIGDFDFANQGDYDARAEALEDSRLLMFPGPGLDLEALTEENPRAASRILLSSVQMVGSRIKRTEDHILENMSWLQELRRRAYEDSGTGLWKQSFLVDEAQTILDPPVILILIKPDRFKILVDSRGHIVGDKAMIRIAGILKNGARRIGRGWAMRFKSNEVGLIIPRGDEALAEITVEKMSRAIAALEPAPPQEDLPAFNFSATLSWALWPEDGEDWDTLFQGTYGLLMDIWHQGGDRALRYHKPEPSHG